MWSSQIVPLLPAALLLLVFLASFPCHGFLSASYSFKKSRRSISHIFSSDTEDDSLWVAPSFSMDPDSDTARHIMEKMELTSSQQKQLVSLSKQIVEWNDRINLVSRKDCSVPVVFGRHCLPCLGFMGFGDEIFNDDVSRVVDVGTGGGFPGLPLAIAYPEIDFLLVDSVGKKLLAVENMAERLGLSNVKTRHARAEELVDEKKSFDVCVGRSVSALPRYCAWVQRLIKDDGKLMYMIGGDVDADILCRTVFDQEIDDLLGHSGVSDKRILVLEKKDVKEIAASSGIKIRVSRANSNANDARPRRPRRAKGEWAKRDPTVPKQRGYEGFKRYDSTL